MILAPSIDFARWPTSVRVNGVPRHRESGRDGQGRRRVGPVIVAPNGRVVDATAARRTRGGQAPLVADVPGLRGAPFTRFGGVPFQWLTLRAHRCRRIGAMEVSRRLRRAATCANAAARDVCATRPCAAGPGGRVCAPGQPAVQDLPAPDAPGLFAPRAAVRHFRRIGHPPHSDLANPDPTGSSANHRSASAAARQQGFIEPGHGQRVHPSYTNNGNKRPFDRCPWPGIRVV